MADIFIVPVDVLLCILRYLDIYDKIAFALTCQIFRQMCVDAKIFRKMDLSRSPIPTRQRHEINNIFKDIQLTQHVTELNLSNFRVKNWQMNDQLTEFVISICPHLEALHVLNCGMNLQRLYHILKEASKLTALSWSVMDFTAEDIQFVVNIIHSSEGSCLRNIKHLHLEMIESKSHFQIAKYLVLSCFRELEELKIFIWPIDRIYSTASSFPLSPYEDIRGFPQPSIGNELQHFHSLTILAVPYIGHVTFKNELYYFCASVLSKKSSSTKWKKLWISESISISSVYWPLVLDSVDQDNFQSVEAFAANPGWSVNAMDNLKSFFEKIGDNTVRSLHLCLPDYSDPIEFCDPISRVGGHSLKLLRLSVFPFHIIPAEQNVFIHTLFSNCMNITELDLLRSHFEKNICETLSKLKRLTIVQLTQCAISSKYSRRKVEISKANLTFVENCKNIMNLDIRGCDHKQFSCRLTDDDLQALEKLRNLKSLTLFEISGITEWTFLRNISEHCKFLTTLRISARQYFNDSLIPILMESTSFLKHLSIHVDVPVLSSEVFWNLLMRAKNLQRLCIKSHSRELLNVPIAVKTIKSLPRLHVLHLHPHDFKNVEDFYDEMIKMLEENESDCRFSFEIVIENRMNVSNNALPLNKAELCDMMPVLGVPRF